MLRASAVPGAIALLFVSPLAWAAQPLPPPPPPPPGYQAPAPSTAAPREPEKPPPAPPAPATAPRSPRATAPAAAPPSPGPSLEESRPSAGEVAVHLESDEPRAHYQLLDPDFPDPVASCTGSCTVFVPPGRYRLHVAATRSTRAGTSTVDIEHGSRLRVSPRGYSGRWVGLGTAIAGMAALVGGVAMFATNDSNSSQSDSNFVAGIVTFLGGATLTPIGWVVFGKSFRPSVRVLPESADDDVSARLGVGPDGLTFSARF